VGLKSDNTVIAVGDDACGQCNVDGWMDISQVGTGTYHTVGLKSDRTMIAAGLETELARWNLFTRDPEADSPVNWQLISGIMIAGIVGLAILFFRRKRVA
jgi:LPXTG-motif cell wall-anchored protein